MEANVPLLIPQYLTFTMWLSHWYTQSESLAHCLSYIRWERHPKVQHLKYHKSAEMRLETADFFDNTTQVQMLLIAAMCKLKLLAIRGCLDLTR